MDYCPDCGEEIRSMLIDHDLMDDDLCAECERSRREATVEAAIARAEDLADGR